MNDEKFRAALYLDCKKARDAKNQKKLSRQQIAERMTRLSGEQITATMLYNWTADSHKKHNMPARYLGAFVSACGGQSRALNLIVKDAAFECVPAVTVLETQRELLKAEIKNINRKIREVKRGQTANREVSDGQGEVDAGVRAVDREAGDAVGLPGAGGVLQVHPAHRA